MISITRRKDAPPPPTFQERARSPLTIASIYVALSVALDIGTGALLASGARVAAGLAGLAGLALIPAAWGAITFLRDDDTVAAGVLFGLVVALGGLVARCIAMIITDRGLGGGMLLFVLGLPAAFLVFLICGLLGAGATSFCRGLVPERWARWSGRAKTTPVD